MNESNLFLGKRIKFTSLGIEDAPVVARWHQDSRYHRMYDSSPSIPHDEAAIAQRLQNSKDARDKFQFGIRLIDNDELIGTIDLNGIDAYHGTAWLGIGIGDEVNRDKGYGREAIQLIVDYGFNELNLHSIELTVFGFNARAIALYEKLGFQRQGTHREFLLRDGKRHDMHLYGLLRREWEASKIN